MIAFGETILMTGDTLSEIETWDATVISATMISFINSLAMWWIYFDVSSEAGSAKILKTADPGLLGLRYQMVHLVLVGALIYCAVGDELVVRYPDRDVSPYAAFMLIGGPILYLLANMIYKWEISQKIQISHIIAIVLLCLLIPLCHHLNMIWTKAISMLIFIFVIIYEEMQNRIREVNRTFETI